MSQKGLNFIPRLVNNQTVRKLGLNRVNVIDIISGLSIYNYCKGPEPDHRNPEQEVYVFGDEIDCVEVYIKLTISKVDQDEIATCISFHEAEYKMKYPMRSGSKK